MVEVFPLALNLIVGLHLHVGLTPLEAVLLVVRYEVVEEQCIGALLLILGQDAHQHHIDTLGLTELQRTQTMPPPERQKASSVTLLQGAGH